MHVSSDSRGCGAGGIVIQDAPGVKGATPDQVRNPQSAREQASV